MAVLQKSFRISTKGHCDVLDVTQQVARIVAGSRIQQGIVNKAGVGSTLGITTLEFEPGCVSDLQRALEKIAPANRDYAHNARWSDDNGYSHLRSALLGTPRSLPISEGRMRPAPLANRQDAAATPERTKVFPRFADKIIPGGDRMIERRAEPRLLCSDLIQVCLDAAGRTERTANLEDISTSGACIQVEEPLPAEAEICLLCAGFRFRGKVKYCIHNEIGYFAGIRFEAGQQWSPGEYQPAHLLDQTLLDRL